MDKNKKNLLFISLFLIVSAVLIGFAVDIEIKLYKLNQAEPVVVNTIAETTNETTLDLYSLHEELSSSMQQTADIPTSTISSSQAEIILGANTTENQITSDFAVSRTSAIVPSSSEPETASQTTHVPTISFYSEPTTQSVDADLNLYRTKSGTKYHKANCSYLSESKIIVTPEEIFEKGYQPCSVCMKGD